MRALFKTRVELCGVDYVCGTHEVPQAHASGWYFDALVKDGLILPEAIQSAPVEVPIEALSDAYSEVGEIIGNDTVDIPKRRGRPSKNQAE